MKHFIQSIINEINLSSIMGRDHSYSKFLVYCSVFNNYLVKRKYRNNLTNRWHRTHISGT